MAIERLIGSDFFGDVLRETAAQNGFPEGSISRQETTIVDGFRESKIFLSVTKAPDDHNTRASIAHSSFMQNGFVGCNLLPFIS